MHCVPKNALALSLLHPSHSSSHPSQLGGTIAPQLRFHIFQRPFLKEASHQSFCHILQLPFLKEPSHHSFVFTSSNFHF